MAWYKFDGETFEKEKLAVRMGRLWWWGWSLLGRRGVSLSLAVGGGRRREQCVYDADCKMYLYKFVFFPIATVFYQNLSSSSNQRRRRGNNLSSNRNGLQPTDQHRVSSKSIFSKSKRTTCQDPHQDEGSWQDAGRAHTCNNHCAPYECRWSMLILQLPELIKKMNSNTNSSKTVCEIFSWVLPSAFSICGMCVCVWQNNNAVVVGSSHKYKSIHCNGIYIIFSGCDIQYRQVDIIQLYNYTIECACRFSLVRMLGWKSQRGEGSLFSWPGFCFCFYSSLSKNGEGIC